MGGGGQFSFSRAVSGVLSRSRALARKLFCLPCHWDWAKLEFEAKGSTQKGTRWVVGFRGWMDAQIRKKDWLRTGSALTCPRNGETCLVLGGALRVGPWTLRSHFTRFAGVKELCFMGTYCMPCLSHQNFPGGSGCKASA